MLARAGGPARSRPSPAARCRAARRRAGTRAPTRERRRPVVRDARRDSRVGSSVLATACSAASSLSSTTRTCVPRVRGGRGGRERRPRRSRRRRRLRRSGQPDGELAALAAPVAVRRDRAAVQLDEAAHDREPEAEAAVRAIERLPLLREQVEDVRQHRRARCRCRCRARADRRSSPSRRRATAMLAAGLGVLGGVGQQVRDHLREARRVAVDDQAARGTSTSRSCRRSSSSGLAISIALATTSATLDRLALAARSCRA